MSRTNRKAGFVFYKGIKRKRRRVIIVTNFNIYKIIRLAKWIKI